MSTANTGSEVEITVESICSMNRAQATMRGMTRVRGRAIGTEVWKGVEQAVLATVRTAQDVAGTGAQYTV